ncbi:MAG: DMT family transporter [Dehalococcoidia bacterium]|nr:MAG: DMT family transporter [Dehalococcoidia bacterium]
MPDSRLSSRHLLALGVGVLAISFAAPLIRLSEAPVLTIATVRLAIAAPPMLLLGAATGGARQWRGLTRGEWVLLGLSAVALATHFGFWVASLQRTSVVASVALVTMQPLFVALGGWAFLGELPRRGTLAGVAVATAGALLLVLPHAGDRGTLAGDAFALFGGVMGGCYILAGRGARRRLSTAAYAGAVYPATALLLLAALLVSGTPLAGHPREAYVAMALLALIPQLVGHNALNWALGSMPAAVVAVAILGEPIGAAAIAVPLLGETPRAIEVAGGAVVLFGVYLALRDARTLDAAPPEV